MHVLAVFSREKIESTVRRRASHAEFRWRLSERSSLSLSFPALDFDLTITFTLDQVSKDGESSDPGLQGSGRAKRT